MHWMLLPLRRYFDFSGRSRRMEFWMFFLFQFVIGMILYTVAIIMMIGPIMRLVRMAEDQRYEDRYGSDFDSDYGGSTGPDIPPEMLFQELGTPFIIITIVSVLWTLLLFIPNLAVTIRRLHDSDRTGWWVMGVWVPYIFFFLAGPLMSMVASAVAVGAVLALLSFLALIGFGITLLVFMFLDGSPGHNRFGASPKGPGHAHTFA